MHVLCRQCGVESESADFIPIRPACGSVDLHLTGGEELMLESIEYTASEEGSPSARSQ